MVDADIARRVDALEAEKNIARRVADHGPPPPIISESNRLLSEARQRRQAELLEREEAEKTRIRLDREREELRQYEEWLSHEPEREAARIEIAKVEVELAEVERQAAPLYTRLRELSEIAES